MSTPCQAAMEVESAAATAAITAMTSAKASPPVVATNAVGTMDLSYHWKGAGASAALEGPGTPTPLNYRRGRSALTYQYLGSDQLADCATGVSRSFVRLLYPPEPTRADLTAPNRLQQARRVAQGWPRANLQTGGCRFDVPCGLE